jgi:hypothetical protein
MRTESPATHCYDTTDGWSAYMHLIPGWLRQHRVDFASQPRGGSWSLLAAADNGNQAQGGLRSARSADGLHLAYRTSEPVDSHGAAAVHSANQRLQQEAGEPRSGAGAVLRVLQLVQSSFDAQDHASGGIVANRPRLDGRGTADQGGWLLSRSPTESRPQGGFFRRGE